MFARTSEASDELTNETSLAGAHCLFCLKPAPPKSVLHKRKILSLQRFLKMKIVCKQLETQVCDQCDPVLETLSKLYEQRELLEMKMEWEIKKLRRIAVLGGRDPIRKLFVGRIYHKNVGGLAEMYSWRRSFSQKSSLKFSSSPRVVLSRLPENYISRNAALEKWSPCQVTKRTDEENVSADPEGEKCPEKNYEDAENIKCEPDLTVALFTTEDPEGTNASNDFEGGGGEAEQIKAEVEMESYQEAEINVKCEVNHDTSEDTGNTFASQFPVSTSNQDYIVDSQISLTTAAFDNQWGSSSQTNERIINQPPQSAELVLYAGVPPQLNNSLPPIISTFHPSSNNSFYSPNLVNYTQNHHHDSRLQQNTNPVRLPPPLLFHSHGTPNYWTTPIITNDPTNNAPSVNVMMMTDTPTVPRWISSQHTSYPYSTGRVGYVTQGQPSYFQSSDSISFSGNTGMPYNSNNFPIPSQSYSGITGLPCLNEIQNNMSGNQHTDHPQYVPEIDKHHVLSSSTKPIPVEPHVPQAPTESVASPDGVEAEKQTNQIQSGGVTQYPCTFCRKSFHAKTNLNRHLKTHTTLKSFFCQTCGRGFRRSDHLKSHARVHTTQPSQQWTHYWWKE